MNYTFYEIALLFFAYSFLAWIAETAIATIKEKDFRNRGFVSGPFCFIYGFTGMLLTVTMQELREDPFFLFLGSMIVATAVEWITGKILEQMKLKKWWDYSGKKWNFDGYICLQYSLVWGLLGFLTVRYCNDLLLSLYHVLPGFAGRILVWFLFAAGTVDILGTLFSVCHVAKRHPRILGWGGRMRKWTLRLATKVSCYVERRIGKAYPATVGEEADEQEQASEKCSLTQLFWLFVIGAFLGDIVETIFCRITAGVWMSRSSLVWGPFSIVWGLAIALATALLYKDREKQEHYIFWTGVFLGGAYEYICSVFTEIVFGTVFWDYSDMPFNLGGRINLLFCLFWGIAAVVWIKFLYPKLSRLIDAILRRTGRMMTIMLVVFMAADIAVSVMALIRYDTRAEGAMAQYRWEEIMDERFDDARMERIYPNAIQQ